jgi:hypothetical protein
MQDLDEIEEWNEYGELKENIGPVPATSSATSTPAQPRKVIPTATAGSSNATAPKALVDESKMVALPGAAEIKARNNPPAKPTPDSAARSETVTFSPETKAAPSTAATPAESSNAATTGKENDTPVVPTAGKKAAPDDEHKSEGKDVLTEASVSAEAEAKPEPKEKAAGNTTTPEEKGQDTDGPDSAQVKDMAEKEVITSVEGLQIGDGKTVNEQAAADPDDATKSVED